MAKKQSKNTPLYIELPGERILVTPVKDNQIIDIDKWVRVLRNIANAPDPS